MAETGEAAAPGPPRIPVTLVTGASEGIGLALAREFAATGKDLLLVARTAQRLEASAEALTKDFDVRVHTCAADLASPRGCDAVMRMADTRNLHVEYLVNNAAIGICDALADSDPDRLRTLVDLNMRAPADLIRRCLGGMIERNAGGILNVGSLGGFMPGPYQAAYYASKAYLWSLTEALAHETSDVNVRVALLAPGPVKTGFHESMDGLTAWYTRFQGLMRDEDVARIGYNNFMCGQTIIIPGFINLLTAVAVRYIPHVMLTPFTGWLFRPREEADDA